MSAAVVDSPNQQEKKKSKEVADSQPRYTPVNTLTRSHSISKKYDSTTTLLAEDPTYSSPYQHLCAASMDYTSMYSKPHQYSDVTVAKPATPKDSVQ